MTDWTDEMHQRARSAGEDGIWPWTAQELLPAALIEIERLTALVKDSMRAGDKCRELREENAELRARVRELETENKLLTEEVKYLNRPRNT